MYRVTFLVVGGEYAIRGCVRRMLDDAGLEQVEFKVEPATKEEIEERARQIIDGPSSTERGR